VIADERKDFLKPCAIGTGFFITDYGDLISDFHLVRDARKVRLLTGLRRDEVATATQAGAGLIDAKVVQVDSANDLALLKAVGRFAPLPIAACRTVALGSTVATVGFPSSVCRSSRPRCLRTATTGEIAIGKSNFDRGMTRAIFKSACRCSRAIRAFAAP
jgi:S1-C subfamily serine protease